MLLEWWGGGVTLVYPKVHNESRNLSPPSPIYHGEKFGSNQPYLPAPLGLKNGILQQEGIALH